MDLSFLSRIFKRRGDADDDARIRAIVRQELASALPARGGAAFGFPAPDSAPRWPRVRVPVECLPETLRQLNDLNVTEDSPASETLSGPLVPQITEEGVAWLPLAIPDASTAAFHATSAPDGNGKFTITMREGNAEVYGSNVRVAISARTIPNVEDDLYGFLVYDPENSWQFDTDASEFPEAEDGQIVVPLWHFVFSTGSMTQHFEGDACAPLLRNAVDTEEEPEEEEE